MSIIANCNYCIKFCAHPSLQRIIVVVVVVACHNGSCHDGSVRRAGMTIGRRVLTGAHNNGSFMYTNIRRVATHPSYETLNL